LDSVAHFRLANCELGIAKCGDQNKNNFADQKPAIENSGYAAFACSSIFSRNHLLMSDLDETCLARAIVLTRSAKSSSSAMICVLRLKILRVAKPLGPRQMIFDRVEQAFIGSPKFTTGDLREREIKTVVHFGLIE